jgi:hypothetical protein
VPYYSYEQYVWLIKLTSWLLCIVPFFSRPFWTYKRSVHSDYDDPSIYPNSNVPHLPPLLTDLLVSALLAVISWALCLEIGVSANAIRELLQPKREPTGDLRVASTRRGRGASAGHRPHSRSTGASFTTHGYLPDDMRSFANRRASASAAAEGEDVAGGGEETAGAAPPSGDNMTAEGDVDSTQSSPMHTPPPRSEKFAPHVLRGIKEDEAAEDDSSNLTTGEGKGEGQGDSFTSKEEEEEGEGEGGAPDSSKLTPEVYRPPTGDSTHPSSARTRSSLLSVDKFRAFLLNRAAFLRIISPVLLLCFNVAVILAHLVAFGVGEAHSLRTVLSLCTSLASLVYLFRFNSEYLNGLSILVACTRT